MRTLKHLALALVFAAATATGAIAADNDRPDVEIAKSHGKYVTYGQPDDWANWKGVFEKFSALYNCPRIDTDMSSAEEIAKFYGERNNPQADSAEIGMVWGPIAVEQGVTLPYKNENWDKLPDWAKDKDGNWFGLYVGVPVFLVNKDAVKNVPQSWEDLKKPEYRNSVVMSDPRTSGTGVNVVLSAAYALGGSIDNLDAAMEYFAELERIGNIKKISGNAANVQKGEVPIWIYYDFLAVDTQRRFKDEVNLEVVFPKEGSIYAPGALILNKFSARPDLAKLFADFVTSDEGQIEFAKGGATPLRYVAGNLALPGDVKAMLLPESFYGNVGQPQDWSSASPQTIAERWELEVISQ